MALGPWCRRGSVLSPQHSGEHPGGADHGLRCPLLQHHSCRDILRRGSALMETLFLLWITWVIVAWVIIGIGALVTRKK